MVRFTERYNTAWDCQRALQAFKPLQHNVFQGGGTGGNWQDAAPVLARNTQHQQQLRVMNGIGLLFFFVVFLL